jgi:hypothetical protein
MRRSLIRGPLRVTIECLNGAGLVICNLMSLMAYFPVVLRSPMVLFSSQDTHLGSRDSGPPALPRCAIDLLPPGACNYTAPAVSLLALGRSVAGPGSGDTSGGIMDCSGTLQAKLATTQ